MPIRKVFDQPGDFAAAKAAEQFLKDCGFSIGRRQRGQPSGIMFGDFDIQKWRNLRKWHRLELHGVATGDFRNGPVIIEIYDTAPAEAIARLAN